MIRDGYYCNVCDTRDCKGESFYCAGCDFDVCPECMAQAEPVDRQNAEEKARAEEKVRAEEEARRGAPAAPDALPAVDPPAPPTGAP